MRGRACGRQLQACAAGTAAVAPAPSRARPCSLTRRWPQRPPARRQRDAPGSGGHVGGRAAARPLGPPRLLHVGGGPVRQVGGRGAGAGAGGGCRGVVRGWVASVAALRARSQLFTGSSCSPLPPCPAAAPTTARARCAGRSRRARSRRRWPAAARCCWSWSRWGAPPGGRAGGLVSAGGSGARLGRRHARGCAVAAAAASSAVVARRLPPNPPHLRCSRSRTWRSARWGSCLGRGRCTRATCTTCCTTPARPRCRCAAGCLPPAGRVCAPG